MNSPDYIKKCQHYHINEKGNLLQCSIFNRLQTVHSSEGLRRVNRIKRTHTHIEEGQIIQQQAHRRYPAHAIRTS
jgi:hypothetical protein